MTSPNIGLKFFYFPLSTQTTERDRVKVQDWHSLRELPQRGCHYSPWASRTQPRTPHHDHSSGGTGHAQGGTDETQNSSPSETALPTCATCPFPQDRSQQRRLRAMAELSPSIAGQAPCPAFAGLASMPLPTPPQRSPSSPLPASSRCLSQRELFHRITVFSSVQPWLPVPGCPWGCQLTTLFGREPATYPIASLLLAYLPAAFDHGFSLTYSLL